MILSAKLLVSIAFLFFGLVLVFKAQPVTIKLREFYLKYALIRYAGEKQLPSNPVYIVVFGVVIIFLGAYGIYQYV